MPSLGQILRQARTERRIDLDEIAKQVKINPKYLRAIESDEPRNVPGGFFYKSFVRQYADALGIDSPDIDAALAAVEIEQEPLPAPHQDHAILRDIRPMPAHSGDRPFTSGRLLPSIGILIAVVFVCSAFYSWWHRIQAAAAVKTAEVSRVLPAPVAKRSPVHPPPQSTPPISVVSNQPAAPSSDAGDTVRLVLAATEDTWVQVSSDGKPVFSGLLKGQETRNIEGRENTRLHIGNAGGLRIEWNGRQIGTLGKRGEVCDVLFTRDRYQLIPKTPKPDEQPKDSQPIETQST